MSLPPNVRVWPDSSWKKYFIKYNIENNKYFVYPRSSFTTNFGDTGVNHSGTRLWQVPLSLGVNSPRLPGFRDSFAKYDAYCEFLPSSLKKLVIELKDYDLTLDLYGTRDKTTISTEYVISRNEISDPLLTYGREIKPHELNLIDHLPGDHFKLGKTENLLAHKTYHGHIYRIFTDYKETHSYFYPITQQHYNEYAKDIRAAQGKTNSPATMMQNSNDDK